MTLTIKPIGRGKWRPIKLTWPDADTRMLPLMFCVGDVFVLGRVTWRICKVEP